MSVKMRQEVERKVIAALLKDAFEAGFTISVDNGEDETKPFDNADMVMCNIMLTDEDSEEHERLRVVFASYDMGDMHFNNFRVTETGQLIAIDLGGGR